MKCQICNCDTGTDWDICQSCYHENFGEQDAANEELNRQADNERWVQENGPDGHGW